MNLNKENMKKLRQLIVFTLIVMVGLWRFDVILSALGWGFSLIFPFLLGAAMAFVLNVPMRSMEKNMKIKRAISLPLALLLFCGIIFIVLFLVMPEIGRTLVVVGENIPVAAQQFQSWAERVFDQNPQIVDMINSVEINWDSVVQGIWSFLKIGAGSVWNTTISAAMSIVSGVTTFFISFVFSIYILLQKEKLSEQLKKLLHAFLKDEKVTHILRIASLTNQTFSNFISGQCLEALILGTMFFLTMTVFRLPYALMISVLIAFTALIPIFGAFIGCAVGAFLILVTNPIQAVGFVALFLLLQQVEGNLIYPHVVGNSVGLPSIWVLVAVTIGGSTMGIVGMLVFIPICSVLYSLLRGVVYARLEEKDRAKAQAKAAEAEKTEENH